MNDKSTKQMINLLLYDNADIINKFYLQIVNYKDTHELVHNISYIFFFSIYKVHIFYYK